jgi:peptidase M54-like protein
MKRFIFGLLLIMIIALSVSFVVIRLWAGGAEDNFFNQRYRAALASRPLPRQFFGLHETGDAKGDYLGPRYQSILVEIDSMAGSNPAPAVMAELADKIQEATGKPTSLYFSDGDIPDQDTALANADIDRLTAAYRNNRSQGNTAVVYLLVLNAPPDDPTLLGTTHREDEIVLFTKALRDFTADSTSTYNNYELSTVLHEFGHLLGLSHNEQPGCLMNARAEADHVPKYSAADVVTDFCDYERQLIGQAK